MLYNRPILDFSGSGASLPDRILGCGGGPVLAAPSPTGEGLGFLLLSGSPSQHEEPKISIWARKSIGRHRYFFFHFPGHGHSLSDRTSLVGPRVTVPGKTFRWLPGHAFRPDLGAWDVQLQSRFGYYRLECGTTQSLLVLQSRL